MISDQFNIPSGPVLGVHLRRQSQDQDSAPEHAIALSVPAVRVRRVHLVVRSVSCEFHGFRSGRNAGHKGFRGGEATAYFLGGVLKLARNSTRSRSSVLESFCTRSAGMAEGPRLRSSMESLATVTGLPFGGDEPDLLIVLAAEDAGDHLAVAGGQHDRFEPLGDLFVGIDDRFEEIRPVLAGTDAGELGPDLAAGDLAVPGPGLVAAQAFRRGLVGEDGTAAEGVAAGEDFAVRGQRVALGLGRPRTAGASCGSRARGVRRRPRSGRAGSRGGPCRR